jgi:hypothetical protein
MRHAVLISLRALFAKTPRARIIREEANGETN